MSALAAPNLSATMPANGVASPYTRFWIASAMANVCRFQPRSSVIGCRYSPKLWRVPSESVRMMPPQISTTSGVRQLVDDVCKCRISIKNAF